MVKSTTSKLVNCSIRFLNTMSHTNQLRYTLGKVFEHSPSCQSVSDLEFPPGVRRITTLALKTALGRAQQGILFFEGKMAGCTIPQLAVPPILNRQHDRQDIHTPESVSRDELPAQAVEHDLLKMKFSRGSFGSPPFSQPSCTDYISAPVLLEVRTPRFLIPKEHPDDPRRSTTDTASWNNLV